MPHFDDRILARNARRRAGDRERARRARRRRRNGQIVVRVEVGHEAISLLCKHGYLSERACDPAEIGRALGRFVAEAAAE
jgi:hypothetical protein